MWSWLLLFVTLAAFVVLGTWLWGTIFGRGEVLPPIDDPDTVMADNRAAVAAGSLDGVRFQLVPRGYRPEQVDAVLADLEAQLAAARRSGRKSD